MSKHNEKKQQDDVIESDYRYLVGTTSRSGDLGRHL